MFSWLFLLMRCCPFVINKIPKRSYVCNFSSCENKAWILHMIWTHDLYNICAPVLQTHLIVEGILEDVHIVCGKWILPYLHVLFHGSWKNSNGISMRFNKAMKIENCNIHDHEKRFMGFSGVFKGIFMIFSMLSWGAHEGSQRCQQSTSMYFQALRSCAKAWISCGRGGWKSNIHQ